MLQYGEFQRSAFMLHCKDSTHQRYLQEENKEAMRERYSQEGTTDSPPKLGASKETDTGINQRLSMAGVGEGPIGNCIVGEPGGRKTSEGWSGGPDSEWQERPYSLLSRPTQDSPQSEGTRGKWIGDTYAGGRPTCHEKREPSWRMRRPLDRPTPTGWDGACVVVRAE